MAMLSIDGVELPDPSEYTYGLMDISASDAGRTEDSVMQKNRVAQKRKLNLGWQNIRPEVASTILTAINPEYLNVTYYDVMDGAMETREFYVGDRSAPYQWWHGTNGRIFSKLTFNLIER